jgi:hypothetical protein
MRPDTTMERAAARLLGGAKSPTKGSINWGVTVVTAVMKDIAVKTPRLEVMQRLSLCCCYCTFSADVEASNVEPLTIALL